MKWFVEFHMPFFIIVFLLLFFYYYLTCITKYLDTLQKLLGLVISR